jgi:hypothetical protein
MTPCQFIADRQEDPAFFLTPDDKRVWLDRVTDPADAHFVFWLGPARPNPAVEDGVIYLRLVEHNTDGPDAVLPRNPFWDYDSMGMTLAAWYKGKLRKNNPAFTISHMAVFQDHRFDVPYEAWEAAMDRKDFDFYVATFD